MYANFNTLVKLSVHVNQKYPSMIKYYEKGNLIFYAKKTLKKGPFSIA